MAEEKVVAEAPVATEEELVQPVSIPRPNRSKTQEEEAAIKAAIEAIEQKIKVIQDKAKGIQSASVGKDEGVMAARAKIKECKGKKEVLIAQRATLYNARDAAREARDSKMSEIKDLKSQTKYKSVDEIDRKIKALEVSQSTTSMSLAKEKEVIKEISELKKQRSLLAQTSKVAADLDGGKAASVDHGASIKDINEQLKAISADMEGAQAVLKKHDEKHKDSAYPALMKEKDELRAAKDAERAKMQALWDKFKEDNKVWAENQKEWDKFKKAQGIKRAAEYEERKKALAEARAAELAKKTPYEEEMDLCDYLVNYLTTTFIAKEKKEEAKEAEEVKLTGEFAGLAMVGGKKSAGDFYLAPTGKKGPKKGNKGGSVAGTKRGKIVLTPETFESFSLLAMDAPTTVDAVPAAVEALNAKKAAFKTMPRGQIVSIAELNQKYEDEAEARRPRDRDEEGGKGKGKGKSEKPSGGAKGPKGGAKGAKIDIASAELFPSLGGGAPKAAAEEKK